LSHLIKILNLTIHMLIHNTVTSIIFQFRPRFGTGIDCKACFQLWKHDHAINVDPAVRNNLDYVWERGCGCVFKNFKFFFIKIEYDLYILDRFDVLMLKMIFKKWKNIIGMHFGTKSYLKSTRNHTAKHVLNCYSTAMIKTFENNYNYTIFIRKYHFFLYILVIFR